MRSFWSARCPLFCPHPWLTFFYNSRNSSVIMLKLYLNEQNLLVIILKLKFRPLLTSALAQISFSGQSVFTQQYLFGKIKTFHILGLRDATNFKLLQVNFSDKKGWMMSFFSFCWCKQWFLVCKRSMSHVTKVMASSISICGQGKSLL